MARETNGRRQLVVCCDGTNNTLTGGEHDTNVLRLFEALRRAGNNDQVLYYDPGVGSPDALPPTDAVQWLRRKWDRLSGLASGQGIYENITQAYSFLMREYRKGDEIWVFGFSRGAFAARSVAGMVNLFGLLRREHRVLLPTLVRAYFAGVNRKSVAMRILNVAGLGKAEKTRGDVAEQIRQSFTSDEGRDAPIHFVGVWDTVESVGPPGFSVHISSSGTIKGKHIRHVRHALSLDEHRWPFLPRLFTDANFGEPTDKQSLRQVWFRGVHSDVGGGYRFEESGLSDEALTWMVDEANLCGLGCPMPAARSGGSKGALRHDPLYSTPLWAVVGMTVRATDRPAELPEKGQKAITAAHESLGGSPPRSVWDKHRSLPHLLGAVGAGAVALMLSGYMLMPGSGWGSFVTFVTDPSAWLAAARLAKDLALAQLVAWSDAEGPFKVAAAVGACPRRALLFDLVFLASYAYVLSRLCGRAFTRLAGWRAIGLPAPTYRALGAALPLLVGGDLLENLLGIVGFSFGAGTVLGPGSFCVGVLASAAKYLGLVGCMVLLLAGVLAWCKPARRG